MLILYISIIINTCLSLFILNLIIKKRKEGIFNITFRGGMFGYISKLEKPLLFSIITITPIIIFSIFLIINIFFVGVIFFTNISL